MSKTRRRRSHLWRQLSPRASLAPGLPRTPENRLVRTPRAPRAADRRRPLRTPTARARPGAMSLSALPNELVSSVLNHLDPLALLRLARTSKRWRALLLARTAEPIWLHAFKEAYSLGCPATPTGVDLPMFASLLFDDICSVRRAHVRCAYRAVLRARRHHARALAAARASMFDMPGHSTRADR